MKTGVAGKRKQSLTAAKCLTGKSNLRGESEQLSARSSYFIRKHTQPAYQPRRADGHNNFIWNEWDDSYRREKSDIVSICTRQIKS